MSERVKPVGRCVPCTVGKHERCNDSLSVVGCACECNEEETDDEG